MSILFIKVKQGMVLISHTYVYLHHIHKPTNIKLVHWCVEGAWSDR